MDYTVCLMVNSVNWKYNQNKEASIGDAAPAAAVVKLIMALNNNIIPCDIFYTRLADFQYHCSQLTKRCRSIAPAENVPILLCLLDEASSVNISL